MKRSELLFKCETAELLLLDAQKKLTHAQRQLDLPLRKPQGVATAGNASTPAKRTGTA